MDYSSNHSLSTWWLSYIRIYVYLYYTLFSSPSVCTLQRLYGPDWQPRVEHGPARERCASRDPRPVHLLHEEPGNQTQSSTTSLHTTWTHTPHTDLKPSSGLFTDDWQHAAATQSPVGTLCLLFLVANRGWRTRKWMLNCVPYPPSDYWSSVLLVFNFWFSVIYLFEWFLLKRGCKLSRTLLVKAFYSTPRQWLFHVWSDSRLVQKGHVVVKTCACLWLFL